MLAHHPGMTGNYFSHIPSRSRGAIRPSFGLLVPPSLQRAQGMPGARCARSRACRVVSTRVSHHGHTGNTRHSPRNGFTAYFALSPVIGLFVTVTSRTHPRDLNASVEASGPHDFAVRKQPPSSEAPLASTASRSNVRDDRETPLCGTGRREYKFDLGCTRNGIFLPMGIDTRERASRFVA